MMYDVIIRGVELHNGSGGWSGRADIGLMYDPPLHKRSSSNGPVTVRCGEVGDLSLHGALEELDGSGRRLSASHIAIDAVVPLARLTDALQIHFAPSLH
jgi:hypothetical protein